MAARPVKSNKLAELRNRAETALGRPSPTTHTTEEISKLMHDLQTHQIELETQNEELRFAHSELAKSRDDYSDLYDSAPAGYVTVSNKGVILKANLTFATLLNKERRSLVEARFEAAIIDDDQDIYCKFKCDLHEVRETRSCELRMHRDGNDPFWARLEGTVVEPTEDTPIRLRLVIIDVTERMKAEEALHNSEQRFRCMADTAPLMSWLAGIDGSATWFSKAWLEFTGRKLEHVVGNGWIQSIHLEDRAQYLKLYQNAFESRNHFSIEFRLLRDDGTYLWVLGHGAPSFSVDGSFSGFAGSCVDISERHEAEASLARRERELTDLFENASVGVHLVGPDGIIIHANQCELDLLGYSRAEYERHHIADFHVDSNVIEDILQRLQSGETLKNYPADLRCKNGKIKHVLINSNVCWVNDQFSHTRCFTRDVTERRKSEAALIASEQTLRAISDAAITVRKRVEHQLTKAMNDAETANLAKSEFLAVISHEMRTPLNSILGMVELTLDTTLTCDQHEMLETCRRSGKQLKHLINDMLDYSQIQAGRFELLSTVFEFRPMLQRMCDSLTERALKKGLKTHWHVDQNIPDKVVGDDRRVCQLIDNLLNNAIKYTEEGYIAFRLEVESSQVDQICLRFSVEDSGIGINPEHRDRIFQRFEQVDASPTREFGGIGLGLSICVQLVELMHGHISVDDGPNGGSIFSFTATFDTVRTNGQPHSIAERSEHFVSPDTFDGISVLLVEDDPPSRLVAKCFLESAGITVAEAVDGLEAVQQIADDSSNFDAVFMDIMMPRMDGIEAIQSIRESNSSTIPIIAMTAQAMRGDRERILEIGADAYIIKPIDRQSVLATLEGVLDGSNKPSKASETIPPDNRLEVLDAPVLVLRCHNNRELLSEIARLFAGTCEETMSRIEYGFASDDSEMLTNALHRLRGAVANVGGHRALEAVQQVESLAKSICSQSARSAVTSLNHEIHKLREAIANLVNSPIDAEGMRLH